MTNKDKEVSTEHATSSLFGLIMAHSTASVKAMVPSFLPIAASSDSKLQSPVKQAIAGFLGLLLAQGAASGEPKSLSPTRDCSKSSFEFHFQEIFTNERIDIITDNEVRAQVVAKTQFQTGLAHVEKLELKDEEEVTLLIRELNLKSTFKVDATKPFVTIRKTDDALHVDHTAKRPGYL